MKTTEENNRLIAEFMGWKEQTDPTERWFGSFREPNGILHKNTNTEPLLFHSSWDWLMPVIEHILTICAEDDELEKYAVITDSVPFIDQTYFEVVQFIEWYNENKN